MQKPVLLQRYDAGAVVVVAISTSIRCNGSMGGASTLPKTTVFDRSLSKHTAFALDLHTVRRVFFRPQSKVTAGSRHSLRDPANTHHTITCKWTFVTFSA